MRLVQLINEDGKRCVAKVEPDGHYLRILNDTLRVYDLALEAGRKQTSLDELVRTRLSDRLVDYDQALNDHRLLPPIDHPDPTHCLVTGTGLTHLGSAQARDAMHADVEAQEPQTDSMRMFQWGLEGGKPPDGQVGMQPEWFYKGNGHNVVSPEDSLVIPSFALEGSEEAELVGLYVISEAGDVLRIGFALGNEFSDHEMEAQNYLYLAHSKLRYCSFGPELLVGPLPPKINGQVRIYRNGEILWEAPFLTGENHMSYSIANLEHHHFKYEIFRMPGDVHCHFLGTATLSRTAGVVTQSGDRFEISAPGFGRPLRNTLEATRQDDQIVKIITL